MPTQNARCRRVAWPSSCCLFIFYLVPRPFSLSVRRRCATTLSSPASARGATAVASPSGRTSALLPAAAGAARHPRLPPGRSRPLRFALPPHPAHRLSLPQPPMASGLQAPALVPLPPTLPHASPLAQQFHPFLGPLPGAASYSSCGRRMPDRVGYFDMLRQCGYRPGTIITWDATVDRFLPQVCAIQVRTWNLFSFCALYYRLFLLTKPPCAFSIPFRRLRAWKRTRDFSPTRTRLPRG